MKILTLLENTSLEPELTPKHGLSLYIETDHKKILFDTGPDPTFIKNAEKLDIDLSQIDLVFLSHGHYDHGGGIPAFQRLNKTARIILSQSALDPFYADSPSSLARYIGLPVQEMDMDRCDFISQDKQIDDTIHIFTRFDKTGFVPLGNHSLRVKNSQGKMIADDFSHEMALLVCEKNANILFTGCAHSGVGNMIKTVLKRSGMDRIDRVMGGFHLLNRSTQETESRERIQLLASELAAYPHTKFYTGHCTGETAFRRLKETMNKNIFEIKTGSRIRV